MRILALVAATLLLLAAPATKAGNVGFQELRISDGADKPLTVGVWYPTDAIAAPNRLGAFVQTVASSTAASGDHLPLVVMSHGTGGWYGEHYDTALALAHAGFVVAAVSHTGDTYDDQSRAARIWGRAEHIHALIGYMLVTWLDHRRIDPDRVGVFGFSAGGFTALVAAGGIADLSRVTAHCRDHPNLFECGVVKASGGVDFAVEAPPAGAFVHDPRIRAAVVAAPALGYAFGQDGLASVRIPVQLWGAEFDHILPQPYYAEAVRQSLPSPPEYHLVRDADHFDFLAPCSASLAKSVAQICVERPGFDRAAFHTVFDAEVVRFFRDTLRRP